MMDADERALFTSGVERAVGAATGIELDAALDELGWVDALALDERTAVGALFDAQGRAAARSSALDLVLGRVLGVGHGPVLLPRLGRGEPPGLVGTGTVVVHGLCGSAAGGDGPIHAVGVAEAGLVLVSVDPAGLERRAVGGLDPELGLVEVVGSAPVVHVQALGPDAWDAAVAAGRRAIAHELVGASAEMLGLACDHARERIQFGVPIASFQAVRHRLADSLVAVESARAALDGAWEAGSAFDAAVAKAVAGRGARLVARHAQQVLAGIGFTLEHPLHRYLRRVRALDGLLGDARSLTREVGDRLLNERGLPSILPL